VRFLLSFNTQVMEENEINVVSNVEFADMDSAELKKMASMTVYVVQTGDTLWKIAKRYNTAMDELESVNGIEGNRVVPGQKLLVLKKV
jgi:LysM repeat protein